MQLCLVQTAEYLNWHRVLGATSVTFLLMLLRHAGLTLMTVQGKLLPYVWSGAIMTCGIAKYQQTGKGDKPCSLLVLLYRARKATLLQARRLCMLRHSKQRAWCSTRLE